MLERGSEAKAALDQVIDRAGALVNLRTAISRYRKPRRRFRFFRYGSLKGREGAAHWMARYLMSPEHPGTVGLLTFGSLHDQRNHIRRTSSRIWILHQSESQARTCILNYSTTLLFDRPEIQARHTAFKRGSAYLERYCLLIAFTSYLEAAQRTGSDVTFDEWMAARPDVCTARDAISENPAGGLNLSPHSSG